jgi:hypothetical protein
MSWRGEVWRIAGHFGPGGDWEPEKDLGTWTYADTPEEGSTLDVGGESYEVVTVGYEYCHVRPIIEEPPPA